MPWPLLARHWPKLLAGLAVLGLIIAVAHYRGDARKWQSAAAAWKHAFNAQKGAYTAAQAAARAKAEAQRIREQSRFDTLAERADNADAEIQDLRSAANRFASANSVRARAGAAQGAAGRTAAIGKGDAASRSDGPGSDTDVVVPRADFDTLVDNTVRLRQVHAWGEDLIAEGLAAKAGD
jgi:hypothetical protein